MKYSLGKQLNGESTLLINFTGIENNLPNKYSNNLYIYIPGVGCSLLLILVTNQFLTRFILI